MPLFTDQLNRTIEVAASPQRIISVVPSQTELLYDLGLGDRVVGITKFCVHPQEWFHNKTRIGGTKKLKLEKIAALQPDLIIANKEENEQEQINWLAERFPVWISDIATRTDAYDMMEQVGLMTGTESKVRQLVDEIMAGFAGLPKANNIPTAYFIWRKPYMVAGGNTFIDHLMGTIGLQNVFAGEGRYPEVDFTALQTAKPQLILLSSEPYPFKDKHIAELQALCPKAQILLVDGEMFSWYGSRLVQAPSYFQTLVVNFSSKL